MYGDRGTMAKIIILNPSRSYWPLKSQMATASLQQEREHFNYSVQQKENLFHNFLNLDAT